MSDMTYEELIAKHPVYKKFADEWEYSRLCYEGGAAWLDEVIKQHPRESSNNYNTRKQESYGFDYGRAIIELFNFYLFEKPFERMLGPLKTDDFWQMFEKDCDQQGTNYDTFMNESQQLASIFGAVGVLVNKFAPSGEQLTRGEEIRRGIYPYVSQYTLDNIFDWKFVRDPVSGRPALDMLKLREASGNEYTIWRPNYWELWKVDERSRRPERVGMGENPLGEVPFFWLQNLKRVGHLRIGQGDLESISRIVAGVVRALSCGDEVIKFAGFPMLLKPYERDMDSGEREGGGNDVSAPAAIHEFDPEMGADGKPSWLEPKNKDSIEAILAWTDRLADEIYRIMHLSGVHGQRRSNNEVSSGLALRYEFQQLNSVLKKKTTQLCEGELQIIRLFCKWQDREDWFKDAKVTRSDEFSVEDLSVALDNIFKSIGNATSQTYRRQLELKSVKLNLPGVNEATMQAIDNEITGEAPQNQPSSMPSGASRHPGPAE